MNRKGAKGARGFLLLGYFDPGGGPQLNAPQYHLPELRGKLRCHYRAPVKQPTKRFHGVKIERGGFRIKIPKLFGRIKGLWGHILICELGYSFRL